MGKFRKSLATLLLLPLCLGIAKPAAADEQISAPKQEKEYEYGWDLWPFLEINTPQNLLEINQISESNSVRQFPDYIKTGASLFKSKLYYYSNLPITSEGAAEVYNILMDIEKGKIDSTSDFISETKNLSEIEKLAIISSIGQAMYNYGYVKGSENEVMPLNESFWEKLVNLFMGYSEKIGVCRHIGELEAEIANNIGLIAAPVSGMSSNNIGHVYVISKLEDGTAIIDGGYIFLIDTKNIEKALDIYQYSACSLVFYHNLFKNSKWARTIITEDGKKYLDFIGYDPTTGGLEEALFNNIPKVTPLSLNFIDKDYLSAGELNVSGLFAKIGNIKGDSLSPMRDIDLAQLGYKGNLITSEPIFRRMFKGIFSGDIIIAPTVSFFGGIVNKDNPATELSNEIFGISGNLIASYNGVANGLNLSSRVAGNTAYNGEMSSVFYDVSLETGASYGFSLGKSVIRPYLLAQFKNLPFDLGTGTYLPQFTEAKGGISLTSPITKNSSVSFTPSFAYRPYEYEFSADAKLETKCMDIGIELKKANKTYEFAPDRNEIELETTAKINDNFNITAKYEQELEDYGEISGTSSLSVTGKIKY